MNTAEWIEQRKGRLAAQPIYGYAGGDAPTAEPVAMAALSARAHGLREAAEAAGRCLQAAQNPDGSVSVTLNSEGPYWTTSLACLAWRRMEIVWPERARPWCRDAYRRGLDFLLGFGGEKVDLSENLGHNGQLVGWPWVQGTHSWLEPTALALLALRQCGRSQHPRAHEAAELIADRLLPAGGANYGNTQVLGQDLRPHVLPSAMCVVALHGTVPRPARLLATARYLHTELANPLAALSLAWTIPALLSTHSEIASEAEVDFANLLQTALQRLSRSAENLHRQNMLLLAMSLHRSPLLDMPDFPWRDAPRGTN